MSDLCIYLPLEDYLAQWFVNEHGGERPVHLLRGSIESKALETYLEKLPEGVEPEVFADDKLPVRIPTFRNRPPETYNYLPPRALALLLNIIRNRFDIQLWEELHHFGKIGKRQDELIYAWMEKHRIDPTEKNWNAIAKRYQRQRNIYLGRERAKINIPAKNRIDFSGHYLQFYDFYDNACFHSDITRNKSYRLGRLPIPAEAC